MLRKFLCVIVGLLAVSAVAAQDDPVAWSAETVDRGDGVYDLVFTADIAPGWHIYDMTEVDPGPTATSFTFEPSDDYAPQGAMAAAGNHTIKYEEVFSSDIGYYSGRTKFTQQIKVLGEGATIECRVVWMACQDEFCTAPQDKELTLIIGDGGAKTEQAYVAPERGDSEKSLWGLIVEAILWGFAALLTPCVFPMVPMTVSYFLKSSERGGSGRFNATLYGIFIVALYTLPIGVIIMLTRYFGGAAVTADIFNWMATHWLPNVLFFLVFMVFAASFFGAFEITMPGSLANKADAKSDKRGIAGIFFMALTLVLVSFSCTGPLVGTVLIKSTQGEFWSPIVAMGAFSVAFALPFTLLAFFPSLMDKLPKSGGWLNSVKVVLGFIEVALGLKFLSVADQTYHWGILDREIYLAIWIVVFSLLGAYLLGKLRFKHDSEVKHIGVLRLFLSISVFSFVVYLIPGMFGAPLKGLSGYMPPMHTQDFVIGSEDKDAAQVKYSDLLHLPHGLDGFFDIDEAMEYARKVDKPVFVDITGHGCVNCREMEARVWSSPRILPLLRDKFVIVALYTDDKMNVLPADWLTTPEGKVLKSLGRINSYIARTRFNVNAQPYYIILDTRGRELASQGYNLDVETFETFLLRGIDKFK